MKVDGVNMSVRHWGLFMVAFGVSIVFSAPVWGQSGGDPAKAQMQEMNRREIQLNNMGANGAERNDPKRSQTMMDQVSEDFQRILTLHNGIVRAITTNQSLNGQFISDATGEIRKRSTRLQSSLKLPKPEPATENRRTESDLKEIQTKDELIMLCQRIESFVRNPIIEKPGTVDAQELQRARKDLQSIVELSDTIKRRVDKEKP